MEEVDRPTAEVLAGWFRCLADPSRILILNKLARADGPMTVGEIVKAVGMGQSTVSHHLKILTTIGFLVLERRGTSSFYQVDRSCMECFPSTAELVMGVAEPRYGPAALTCQPGLDAGARGSGRSRRRPT